jgi:hypothetical protein
MKRELDDDNVIARWSSRGMTPKQMVAKAAADMDEVMEKKTAEFEADMADLGVDPEWVADRMNQQRIEYAAWKAEKLAYLERWFGRGGETLN